MVIKYTIWIQLFIGFPKILDSGYDEENDVFFISLNKLDEDLSDIIKRNIDNKLEL